MHLTNDQLQAYLGDRYQPGCQYKISTHTQARQKVLQGWVAITTIPDHTENGTNVIIASSNYVPPHFPPVPDQPQVPLSPTPQPSPEGAVELHRLNLELAGPKVLIELLELLYEAPPTPHDKPARKAAKKKAARVAKAAREAANTNRRKFTLRGLLTWADPK